LFKCAGDREGQEEETEHKIGTPGDEGRTRPQLEVHVSLGALSAVVPDWVAVIRSGKVQLGLAGP
jgi:hypothetical protein